MSADVKPRQIITHTQTYRDKSPRALRSPVELTRDLVDTVCDAGSGLLFRIVSGKGHRKVDEMFRGSKRARERSQ